jgi:hypothetical protein
MVQTGIRGVRAGEHTCSDWLVIDMGSGPAPGYHVRYREHVYIDPSGQEVMRGGTKLLITIKAPTATANFPAGGTLADVTGFRTFRSVRGLGSFEGITSIGLRTRARLPFTVARVTDAAGHHDLVVKVAHHW